MSLQQILLGIGGSRDYPSLVATGSFDQTAAGTITLSVPAGTQTNDIIVAVIYLRSGAESTGLAGWTKKISITDSDGDIDVWWIRYDGSTPDLTLDASTDTQIGCTFSIRGCVTSGDPFDAFNATGNTGSASPADISGATTVTDKCLVMLVTGADRDSSSTTTFSSWTNSNLTEITEILDKTTALGLGGGFGVALGKQATAGNYGTSTVAHLGGGAYISWSAALKPA